MPRKELLLTNIFRFLYTWIAIQRLNDDPLTAAFICDYNYRQDHPLTLPQLRK